MGLEPTTFSLATRRSTTELCPPLLYSFSKRQVKQHLSLQRLIYLLLLAYKKTFIYNPFLNAGVAQW